MTVALPAPPPSLLAALPESAFAPLFGLYLSLGQGRAARLTLREAGHVWQRAWPSPEVPPHAPEVHALEHAGVRGELEVWPGEPLGAGPHPLAAAIVRELEGHGQQAALQAAHDQLQAMVQAAPLAVYALTLEGLVRQWNAAAAETLGLSGEAVLGQQVPDDRLRGAFAALRRSAGRGPRAITTQHVQLTGPGGEARDLTLTAAPMPGGLVGTAQAVSRGEGARHQASQQLALLESVLAHANDSVLITEAEPHDLPGPRIVYANAAFTRTTGYSLEEVLGQTPRILHGPRTDPRARATIREALKRWKPVQIEVVNYRKDGTEFWVELSIAPVADETGWYTHWISIQRDITERKQFAEHLDRERALVLELAAKHAPLPEVLGRLCATLERQFPGRRAAVRLSGEGQGVYTASGEAPGGDWAPGAWRHEVRGATGENFGELLLRGPGSAGPNPDERAQLDACAGLAALVIERDQAHAALEWHALYDALTGLPNRVLFERTLRRALGEARAAGRPVAVGLMDLDRFKQINDTLGHSVGDALLQQVAARLRGVLGPGDTLARMGGDEFLLVLGGLDSAQDVAARAGPLLDAFAQPFTLQGHEVFVRPSLGVSVCPEASTSVEALLQQADTAMYAAKRRGGGHALYQAQGGARWRP